VHVIANFIEMFLDVLVDAMLEAPLDKRKLAHRRAMRRLGNRARGIRLGSLLEDVRAATKGIKEQTVVALQLVLVIQVRIHDRRANLQELGTALGKVCDSPIKSTQPRTLGGLVIEGNQGRTQALFRLEICLDNFLQKLAFTIRDAMLDLFMVFANFDGTFFEPKGPFDVDRLGSLCHLLKFLIFLKIILRFKFTLANAPGTPTRRLGRAELYRNVTWNDGIKLHFEKRIVKV
jgi:hypothetical protein